MSRAAQAVDPEPDAEGEGQLTPEECCHPEVDVTTHAPVDRLEGTVEVTLDCLFCPAVETETLTLSALV